MQNNISCCKMFITATVALYFLLLLRGSSPSFIFYHLRAGVFIFSCLTIKTATSLTKWTHDMRQSPYFCCPHQEPSSLTSLTTSSGLIYPWPASLLSAGQTQQWKLVQKLLWPFSCPSLFRVMALFLSQEDCESTDDLALPADIFQLSSRGETHAVMGSVQDVRPH